MNREQARELFVKKGLNYNKLNNNAISLLNNLVIDELSKHNSLKMAVKTFDFNINENGVYGEISVSSHYFNEREGITFNRDGFIGFAGWASDENVKPFIGAFEKWCEKIE